MQAVLLWAGCNCASVPSAVLRRWSSHWGRLSELHPSSWCQAGGGQLRDLRVPRQRHPLHRLQVRQPCSLGLLQGGLTPTRLACATTGGGGVLISLLWSVGDQCLHCEQLLLQLYQGTFDNENTFILILKQKWLSQWNLTFFVHLDSYFNYYMLLLP